MLRVWPSSMQRKFCSVNWICLVSLCQMILREHLIWVLRPNLIMRQLLRWRKIGYSGSQLLRKVTGVFCELRAGGEVYTSKGGEKSERNL